MSENSVPAQGQIDADSDDEQFDGDVPKPVLWKRQAVCPGFLVVRRGHRLNSRVVAHARVSGFDENDPAGHLPSLGCNLFQKP